MTDSDVLEWLGEFEPTKGEYAPSKHDRRLQRIKDAPEKEESKVVVGGKTFSLNKPYEWTRVNYNKTDNEYSWTTFGVKFINRNKTIMAVTESGMVEANRLVSWRTIEGGKIIKEYVDANKVDSFLENINGQD